MDFEKRNTHRRDSQAYVTAPSRGRKIAAWLLSVRSLPTGMKLDENVYDPTGELILPAGSRVTSEFLDKLGQRGIDTVHVSCPTTGPATDAPCGKHERQLDDLLARVLQGHSGAARPRTRRRDPLPAAELATEAQARIGRHTAACDVVAEVANRCGRGATQLAQGVDQMVEELMNLATVDAELVPLIVGMQEPQNEYLFAHSVNVSLLSMTVAAQMGMEERKILELGTGALLLDVGMLRVPESIRFAPRALTADERIEVNRHTLYTLDWLQRLEGLPAAAPFVGYQAHERVDGSGYPRGRSGMFIHQYAKIAAVIDVYSAMIRPRPYRPAWPPYVAMKEVLLEGSRGRLDRSVIRSLLDCLSLFPVGSVVELDSGVLARVVRANPGNHTRPVVAAMDSSGRVTKTVIDLQQDMSTYVVRAIGDAAPSSVADDHSVAVQSPH